MEIAGCDFLTGYHFLAGTAKAGEMLQILDTAKNRPGNLTGSLGVVVQDVLNDALKLVGGFGCPPDAGHDSMSRSMRLTTSS